MQIMKGIYNGRVEQALNLVQEKLGVQLIHNGDNVLEAWREGQCYFSVRTKTWGWVAIRLFNYDDHEGFMALEVWKLDECSMWESFISRHGKSVSFYYDWHSNRYQNDVRYNDFSLNLKAKF